MVEAVPVAIVAPPAETVAPPAAVAVVAVVVVVVVVVAPMVGDGGVESRFPAAFGELEETTAAAIAAEGGISSPSNSLRNNIANSPLFVGLVSANACWTVGGETARRPDSLEFNDLAGINRSEKVVAELDVEGLFLGVRFSICDNLDNRARYGWSKLPSNEGRS